MFAWKIQKKKTVDETKLLGKMIFFFSFNNNIWESIFFFFFTLSCCRESASFLCYSMIILLSGAPFRFYIDNSEQNFFY